MEELLSFLKYLLFLLFRLFFSIVQSIIWKLNGTSERLQESQATYKQSAQVLDIVWKGQVNELAQPPTRWSFIYTHNDFVHPDYVLKDEVSLYYVTPTEAVFIETEPGVDVAHSSVHCFLRAAQFHHAKRLIIIPSKHFETLAQEVGDPTAKIIILSNTGRCGSTLVSQIFEHTGRCVSLSEPLFFNFPVMYGSQMSQTEMDDLMVSSLRLQCKPRKDMNVEAFVLKTMGQHTQFVPMYVRLFPYARQVYLYRNALKTTESFFRFVKTMLMAQVILQVDKVFPAQEKLLGIKVHPKVGRVTAESMGLYLWADCCKTYNDLYQGGTDIRAIRYDDFVKNSKASIQAMLRYCDLPEAWAEDGVKAMDKDSQRSSPISRQNMKKTPKFHLEKSVADTICDVFDLPRIDEECVLKGTITYMK